MPPRSTGPGTAAVLAAVSAGSAYLAGRTMAESEGDWWRINYRGSAVDLVAGPAVALGTVVGSVAQGNGPGVCIAAIGGALVGHVDDIRGTREDERFDKGLAGHWRALRSGRVSAGVIKVVGLLGVGVAVAVADGRRTPVDIGLDAACVAGTANLVNLLDLRPGRALKAGALAAAGSSALGTRSAGLTGACLAILPLDVREHTMLGDAGANAVGAALGAGLVKRTPRVLRWGWLALVTVATAASERTSFSALIESSPTLRRFDQLGRKHHAASP